MSSVPDDLRYSKEHEWIRVDGDTVTVGITAFAQEQLGDVVFVELPEKGARVRQHSSLGVVESVKAASDIYSPVAGEIVGANDALGAAPEQVNQDAYAAWMYRVKPDDAGAFEKLLDAAAYEKIAAE